MRLLYVSVHQVLEHDEIGILSSLGHDVFSLGSFLGDVPLETFRPAPSAAPRLRDFFDRFTAMGGLYAYGMAPANMRIPSDFVRLFDAVIVMHDLTFIRLHWDALSNRPTIWRSIGVSIEHHEPEAAALRPRGLKIVRYSPMEATADNYAGHDAIIRFGKWDSPSAWNGRRPEVLTFCHGFRARYPREHALYRRAVAGFPSLLGGADNESGQGVLGSVPFDRQRELLGSCATYFYAAGTCIPYTLNFVEAWLAGIPVVVMDCHAAHSDVECKFAEVSQLITHGKTGFVVRSSLEAAETFRLLITNREIAEKVGAAGARTAADFFSANVVSPLWQKLLTQVAG